MSFFIVFLSIILILMFISAMVLMIIFERNKPRNILFWTLLFLLIQIVGYVVYFLCRLFVYKKSKRLNIKLEEDQIFQDLSSAKLKEVNVESLEELFDFNKRAYNADVTCNNSYSLINSYAKFYEELIKDMNSASSYIIFEAGAIDEHSQREIFETLMSVAQSGVVVKFIYDNRIARNTIKALRQSGVKAYRFDKFLFPSRYYSNIRNQVVIDGKIAYIGSFKFDRTTIANNMIADMYLRLKGDIIQSIDLSAHKDVIFASGKYFAYEAPKKNTLQNDNMMQFVVNECNTDIELMLIKAICMAKSTILLELESFVPTESIVSLLKYAINSNIDVRIMIPMKSKFNSCYFATRAYAKELALIGANVYLYDGYINFNSITIDSKIVICGSFSLDKQHLKTSLQNVIIMTDQKVVSHFEKMFDNGIENSYRINDAKYMLLREKFFKNFI